MRIKLGILPRKSINVRTLTAPREYFPSAHVKRLMLQEIVVESNANISLSMSILGTDNPNKADELSV